jgi:dihydropteroate synthase
MQPSSPRSPRVLLPWRLRARTLELGRRTFIMGVVNVTPDSFSDGGLWLDPEAAFDRAMKAFEDGADLVDIGGESTRPGSRAGGDRPAVSSAEEQSRVLPVIEAVLRSRPDAVLSVDTYKAETARAALRAGVEIVNDVSGFSWDTEMASVCAEAGCGAILTHARGRPEEWKEQPQLDPARLLASVEAGLRTSLARADSAGILGERVVLDPGYGFGKRLDENFALLARQSELLGLGRPLLAGLSRKSFLGHGLASLYDGRTAPVGARETASIAALVAAILGGASVVRVHDVHPAREAALIADAILAAG